MLFLQLCTPKPYRDISVMMYALAACTIVQERDLALRTCLLIKHHLTFCQTR